MYEIFYATSKQGLISDPLEMTRFPKSLRRSSRCHIYVNKLNINSLSDFLTPIIMEKRVPRTSGC